jgi:outer membrane protein assembly factor BamB
MHSANPTKAGMVVCVMLLTASCLAAQDWPQWRGPNRDNRVVGFTEPKTWPKELTQKWKVNVGLGDASPVLVGDKIYTFTRQGDDEVTLCLNAKDGTEIWRDKYAAQAVSGAPRAHPGPRGSPAAAEGKICTLGVGGVLSCLDADKGTVVWRKESKAWPRFFAASSPIIVEGNCIAQLGKESDGSITAYDLAGGGEKWKWSGAGPAYASPVLLNIDGKNQVVALTADSVVGLAAADGKLLWQISFVAKGMGSYNSITPIVVGQMVIFGREGSGTTAVKVEKKEDGYAAAQVWQKTDSAGKYNTPMLKDGLLFGITSGRNLFCMKAETGEVLWSDSTKRGECGAVLDTGAVLLALSSDSQLIAFKPSDKAYEELAKYKVADSPTWAVPIIAGNRVFVKDRDSLILWTME